MPLNLDTMTDAEVVAELRVAAACCGADGNAFQYTRMLKAEQEILARLIAARREVAELKRGQYVPEGCRIDIAHWCHVHKRPLYECQRERP